MAICVVMSENAGGELDINPVIPQPSLTTAQANLVIAFGSMAVCAIKDLEESGSVQGVCYMIAYMARFAGCRVPCDVALELLPRAEDGKNSWGPGLVGPINAFPPNGFAL